MNANQDNTQGIKRVGQHHSFDADLAVELKSIDLAVLVHHFQFWIRHNAAIERNFHENRTWTYQTLKDIAAHFPYWSEKQVRVMIDKLVAAKILIKGNFNTNAYDRTIWYSFQDEQRFSVSRDICPNGQMDSPKKANPFTEKGTPIPDPLKKKKKKRDASLPSIEFNYETFQFDNILDEDLLDWAKICPGVDIKLELEKMRQWLKDPSNPERDGNRTFITNWLSRAQKAGSKAPKKSTPANPEPGLLPNANGSIIPYNSSIAYSILHDDGVDAYVNYLKSISEQKYYNNYLNGKYEKNFRDYLEEQQGE